MGVNLRPQACSVNIWQIAATALHFDEKMIWKADNKKD